MSTTRKVKRETNDVSFLIDSHWVLQAVTDMAGTGNSLDELCMLIIDRARLFVTAAGGSVMLYNDNAKQLKIRRAWGLPDEDLVIVFQEMEGFAGHAFSTKELVVSNDAPTDPRFKRIEGQNTQLKSLMCFPLLMKERSIGVLNLHNKLPDDTFTKQDEQRIRILCGVAGPMLGNVVLFKQVQDVATYDQMTGLYRREIFPSLVQKCLHTEDPPPYAHMIVIDLDRFREINNTFGHLKGDEVVTKVGERLRKLFTKRSNILCARWGGDEFAIFISSHYEREGQDVLDQIRAALRDITMEEIGTLECSGGVVTKSAKVSSYDILIREADNSMYEEKRQKKAAKKTGGKRDEDKNTNSNQQGGTGSA